MKKAFLAALAASALLGAAGVASAGVITTGTGVIYTATLTGDLLNLNIDATGIKSDLRKATQLDGIEFNMFNLTGVTLVSAPTQGWIYDFDASSKKADSASFTATPENELLLAAPMSFQFKFAGDTAGLDFTQVGVTTSWLINKRHSTDVVKALDVSILPVQAGGAAGGTAGAEQGAAEVPEPQSAALILTGLALLGFSSRKFRRG